jgi:1,4-dihydroxy-2-naphthoyl-CoA synthase
MSEPIKLVTPPSPAAEIKDAVVDLLCEALIDAQKGKVVGIIILSKEADGGWYHRASGSLSVREEIGAIEILKHDRICSTFEET